jgi:hypothetical protein
MNNKALPNKQYIIRTNYGDDSLALIQWAFESQLKQVTVVYIDTGWAAKDWIDRVSLCEQYVQAVCQFKTIRITSKITFDQAVLGRGEFPSPKFQWCASLLKGLPFLDWLDENDPQCQAIILIAKRKAASKAQAKLLEYIENCEFHNDRKVWHPILELIDIERDNLLRRAGFTPLLHRSLECHPCINSVIDDFKKLHNTDIVKVQTLEIALNIDMVSGSTLDKSKGILNTINKIIAEDLAQKKNKETVNEPEHYLDLFYRGCGNPWGCGL